MAKRATTAVLTAKRENTPADAAKLQEGGKIRDLEGKLELIGARLRHFRSLHQWTLRQLSEATDGLSIGYLSDIENGRTSPSIVNLFTIAAAFDLTLGEFLGENVAELTRAECELIEAYRNEDWRKLMHIAASKEARDGK